MAGKIGIEKVYEDEGVNTVRQAPVEEVEAVEMMAHSAPQAPARPKKAQNVAKENSNIVTENPTKRMREQCLECLREFEECFADLPDFGHLRATTTDNLRVSKGQYKIVKDELLPKIMDEKLAYESWDGAKKAVGDNLAELHECIKDWDGDEIFTRGQESIDNMYKVFMSASYEARFKEVGLGDEFACAHEKFVKYFNDRAESIAMFDEFKQSVKDMEELMAQTDAIVEKQKAKDAELSR